MRNPILESEQGNSSKNLYLSDSRFFDTNGFFLSRASGDFFNHFCRGAPNALINGEIYSEDKRVQLENDMLKLFGDHAEIIKLALRDQAILRSTHNLVAFRRDKSLDPMLRGTVRANVYPKDGKTFLDVSFTDITKLEPDDSSELSTVKIKFKIPGTVSLHYIFDPSKRKFRREKVESTTHLLSEIVKGRMTIDDLDQTPAPNGELPRPVEAAFNTVTSNQGESGSAPSSPSPRSHALTPRASATQETPAAPRKTRRQRTLVAIRNNNGLMGRLFDSDAGGIDMSNFPPNAAMQFVLGRLKELVGSIPFPDELYSKETTESGGIAFARALARGNYVIPSEFGGESIPASLRGQVSPDLKAHADQIFDAMKLLNILGRDLLFDFKDGKFVLKPDLDHLLKAILRDSHEIEDPLRELASVLIDNELYKIPEEILNAILIGYFSSLLTPLVTSEHSAGDSKLFFFLNDLSNRTSSIKSKEIFGEVQLSAYQTQLLEEARQAQNVEAQVSVSGTSTEKSVELSQRENIVRSVFGFMRVREIKQKESGYLRDKLPGDHLDEVENFLVDQLAYGQDYSDLSYAEFLQLTHFAVEAFASNAENDASKIPLSFKDTQKKGHYNYYESSLLPRIRREKFEIVCNRGSLLRNLKELELSTEKMNEFSNGLVEFVSAFCKKNSSFFSSEKDALQALCRDIFRDNPGDENDVDELIYRFMYLLKYNKVPMAGPFIQILLDEVINLKIIRTTRWPLSVINEFKETKFSVYEILFDNICEDMNRLIQRNESSQKTERAQALEACWVVGQNGKQIFEKAEQGSEDCAVGLAMQALSTKLVGPWDEHFKAHHVCLSRDKYVSKNRDKLINEVEGIIEKEISSKRELTQYDGIGERIRIYIQNIFMTVFTVGIAPLVRKYAFNKSAFFVPPREEIIENVPQQLRAVKSS